MERLRNDCNTREQKKRDAAGILGKDLFSVPGQEMLCTTSAGVKTRAVFQCEHPSASGMTMGDLS